MDSLEQARQRVERGELDAFRSIVAQTSDMLVRLSARILGNVSDAEDVVQEAYVKTYQVLTTGQFGGRSSLKTWLYRVVTNGSIDALRKRQRKAEVGDDVMVDMADAHGSGALEAGLALQELADLMQGLPEDQRAALVLKGVEGLSTAEIADIMQCSEGAVEQRLVRARVYLRSKRRLP